MLIVYLSFAIVWLAGFLVGSIYQVEQESARQNQRIKDYTGRGSDDNAS